MIYVIATLTTKPGAADALREPAAHCRAESLKEKGCLAYELHQSFADPDRLVFVEKWETREDLTAHSKQPHLLAWREASAPYLISRRIEVVHPAEVESF
jgi:quinol monooxygenase YgiN